MKMTLLELVQTILSDMGGDEVNSIDDTVESAQVASIVRNTYNSMVTTRMWPHMRKLIKLIPYGDSEKPTHMKMPERLCELISIKYESSRDGSPRKDYRDVKYLDPEDFLRYIYSRNTSDENTISVFDPSGAELFILTNCSPTYVTSFDDVTMVFDSYDSVLDDSLQASKIQCFAYMLPEWNHTDKFVPDLPAEAFQSLLQSSKNYAFSTLSQRFDSPSATEARRQSTWLSRKAWRAAGGIKYPNYGRRSGGRPKDPTFRK